MSDICVFEFVRKTKKNTETRQRQSTKYHIAKKPNKYTIENTTLSVLKYIGNPFLITERLYKK